MYLLGQMNRGAIGPRCAGLTCLAALVTVAVVIVGCNNGEPTLPAASPTDTPAAVDPTATPPMAEAATDPTLPPARAPGDDSSLLRVMEKLPASFGEEGVWFTDYGRAWDLAGLPPRPSNLEDYLALSDEEREAYLSARRELMPGPTLLSISQSRDWEELFGFSSVAVSLAVGTGPSYSYPFATAYFEGDLNREVIEQRLLGLGYREEPVSGGTYYAIRGDREQDLQSPTHQTGVLARMNRVFLDEGALAAGPDTDPIVDVVGASAGETPILAGDPLFSRLGASLGRPLSASLLPRQVALEPEGQPQLSYDAYPKPNGWGDIHQWEALGAGFTRVEGEPFWAISLFYPDPAAAAADAGEIINRMKGYESAIPLIDPTMSAEGLARIPQHPIDASCASLTPVHTNDDSGSVLTIWCQVAQEPAMSWWIFLMFRDLGFLLP